MAPSKRCFRCRCRPPPTRRSAPGGGIYSLTSNGSETSVQFQFLGVKSIPPPGELAIPLIPTTIQCTVVHKGESMSLRLFTSGTALDPFTVTELDHNLPTQR